jgi:hypothetical protein
MEVKSQRPKGYENTVLVPKETIETLDFTKVSDLPLPAEAVFGSVCDLLTLIRVCFLLSCNGLLQVHT